MLNHQDRRVFTVGPKNCDFNTLGGAIAELNTVGSWSATNRALLLVQGQITETPADPLITMPSFVDVHFTKGASVQRTLGVTTWITFNNGIDSVWSADSNTSPHLIANANTNGAAIFSQAGASLAALQNIHAVINGPFLVAVVVLGVMTNTGIPIADYVGCVFKANAGLTTGTGSALRSVSNQKTQVFRMIDCYLESNGPVVQLLGTNVMTLTAIRSRFIQNGTPATSTAAVFSTTTGASLQGLNIMALNCYFSRNAPTAAGVFHDGNTLQSFTLNLFNSVVENLSATANSSCVHVAAQFNVASEIANSTFISLAAGTFCFFATTAKANVTSHNNVFRGTPTGGAAVTFAAQSLNGSNTLI